VNLRRFILTGHANGPAVRSVFDGIVDQVFEDLAHSFFVGPSGQVIRSKNGLQFLFLRLGPRPSCGAQLQGSSSWPNTDPRGREGGSAQFLEAIELGSCSCGLLAICAERGGARRQTNTIFVIPSLKRLLECFRLKAQHQNRSPAR
jgi:hypothetical protein